jgi:hypothetical protein
MEKRGYRVKILVQILGAKEKESKRREDRGR